MKKKKLLTLILSLFLMCSVVCGMLSLVPNTKAEDDGNPEWLSSFTMLAGAEVRTAEPNGIRFTTEISASEYDALMAKVASGEYQSVEFGTLICPMEYAEEGAITSETNAHVTKIVRDSWDVEYNPTEETDVYQYNGDLIGLTAADLVREYQALGYCTITPAEGEAVTYYATVENEGDNVRSPLYVASYNVINYGNEDDYLLAMIDSAMEGKTLALSQTSASIYFGETVDFPMVATVDGARVSVAYSVENSTIASYENGKLKALSAGSTNVVATLWGAEGTYTATVPVTVSIDTRRFEGLETKTVTEQDGSRKASSTLVYEKGVGLWFMIEADHNAFTKGWGGSGLDLDVTINGKEYWLYYGTSGVGVVSTGADGVGFDISRSTIFVTANAQGAATAYTTLMVALLPEQTLLADGVTQDKISEGIITTGWVAIKSPGEDSITGNGDGMWLIHGEAHVGTQGYFIPVPEIDVSRFAGLEVKESTTKAGLSAVMVYEKGVGLWVKAEATHDNFVKGWGGQGVNLEVGIGSLTHFVYYGTGGVGTIGFDADASAMRVTENEGEGEKYSTLVVGLITDEKLLAAGLTQEQLDKAEIPVVHAAFGSPNDGWWYIHKDVYVGEEGYFVPAPVEPEQPTIDVSRFEGLEAKTKTEQDGSRSVSAVLVYEKGVGLWFKIEANHNAFTKGWGGSGLDLDVALNGKEYWLYYDASGVGAVSTGADGVGFDLDESVIIVTENAQGSATAYSTLMVGLIPEQTLLADGMTQDKIDAGEVSIEWMAIKSPGETSITGNENGLWVIHGTAHVGEEGYFIPDPFKGLPTASLVANDKSRVLTSAMYYEKGVGLWVKIDAKHTKFTKGWAGTGLDLDITVEGVQMILYYGTNGPASCFSDGASGGFDMTKTTFVVTENAADDFSTAIVGLIPVQTLLDKGVSQATLDRGYLKVTTAFKSPGEGSFVDENGYTTPADWWYIHRELLVGANGYLTGGTTLKTMNFTDTTTKKAFNFSAKLTEFGLYVHAEVKADAIADGLIALAYYTNYWSPSNGGVCQLYLGRDGGQAPTWKRVTHFTGIDAATYGSANYLVYEALYDWTFLTNLGLMSLDSTNPLESTIYLSPSFLSGESMEYNERQGDGSLKANTSAEWRFGGSQWTAIDSGTVRYITLHITKNGIIN